MEEKAQGGVDPGVVVGSVEVSFFARSTPERWREFMEALGCKLELDAPSPQPQWETSFVALPEVIKKGDRFLTGEVHTVPDEPEETHWVLRLKPVPSPDPPHGLTDASRQVGGYPGILGRIVKKWPAEPQVDVKSTVLFFLDEKNWRSPFAPARRMALKPVTASGHQAVLSFETYSWSLSSSGPLQSITDMGYIKQDRGLFALSCSGQTKLKLESDTLSRLEVATWQLVRDFMKAPARRSLKHRVNGDVA